jgi:hypothetical protein
MHSPSFPDMNRYLRPFVEAFRQTVEDYQTSNRLNPPGGSVDV